MSTRISIEDDGDEQVFVIVGGKKVFTLNHGEHGWDGMEAGIKAVEAVANELGFVVVNTQDIV